MRIRSTKQAPKRRKTLNVHIKILTTPEKHSLRERFDAMKKVYDTAGIDVNHASTEVLHKLEALNDLDIGGFGGTHILPCDGKTTDDQERLAQFRDNVPDGEIVVYICRIMTNGNSGCATHPPDKIMAAITANSALYMLAHEVGHLLGLEHPVKDIGSRLMNDGGPDSRTEDDPLPDLTKKEIKKMRNSTLLT